MACKMVDNMDAASSSAVKIHIPEVDEAEMPELGIIFSNPDEAFENIGCSEEDVWDRRKGKQCVDAQMLYDYFKEMKEINPAFIFNIETDKKDRITHIFWANPTFRMSYNYFGDVVSFGMTYKTNRYGLIFATFMGVNHHGQSILFGCGLLPNETFDTFVWLFSKWLEAMPGGPPEVIITDQNEAMTKAIQFVMPATYHHFCLWHVLYKMHEKLGDIVICKDDFFERLKHCICTSNTPEQFELEWKRTLEEFEMTDNNWLTDLYNSREKWVPIICLEHVYFGGMPIICRHESIDMFVERYLSKKTTLHDFILQFEREIACQEDREIKADLDTLYDKPKLKTTLEMEKQIAETYTQKMFCKFQDELLLTVSYVAKLVKDNLDGTAYIVSSLGNEKEIQWMVIFIKKDKYAACSCQMFEFLGIPCGHVLCVLKQEKIVHLPQQYILERWNRHAKEGCVYDNNGVEIKAVCEESLIGRYRHLSYLANLLVNEASLSRKACQYVQGFLAEMYQKVKEINSDEGRIAKENKKIAEAKKKKGKMMCVHYCNPPRVNMNERGKRHKSFNGKAQTKPRLCNGCNKRGVSHDKRNCPTLLKRCKIEIKYGCASRLVYGNDASNEGDTLEMSTSDNEGNNARL
ncbi:hypothetical protein AAC387_Pa05g1537 [Persea americana]